MADETYRPLGHHRDPSGLIKRTVFSGVGAPANSEGVPPDSLYINEATGATYKMENGAWALKYNPGGSEPVAVEVPIGSFIGWDKDRADTPPIEGGNFVECNGQVLNDAESPYDGQTIPNLNGQLLFMRGGNASGAIDTGGSEDDTSVTNSSPDVSVRASSYEPPSITVVWIMRVK